MLRLALVAIALVAMAAGLALVSSSDTGAGLVAADRPAQAPVTLPPPPSTLPLPSNEAGTDLPVTKSPPRSVRIPAIEVDTAVIDLGLEPDGALETPRDYALAGWWAGGTTADEPGPTVIVGHVDDHRGPAVFYRLSDLVAGDEIEVTSATGTLTTFVVTETAVYDKDAFPTERVYGPTEQPTLRLITCGGSFDRSERSYEDNVVVYAELR